MIAIPVTAFVGIVSLYVLLNDVVMPLYVRSGKIATVPNVVGMPQAAAVRKLTEADYEPVQYEVRFDDAAAEGTIIRETPEAGEQTKPGRKVFLIISGGREMAVVPSLVGKVLRDAKLALLKDNLSIGTTEYAFNDSVQDGIVYQQYPVAGIKISAATKVNLMISKGPQLGRVPVPDLHNLQLNAAIAKLNDSKLAVGNVTFQSNPDSPPNTVVEQYPNAGDLVNENSPVDLFVVRDNSSKTPEH